jgi:hypothetical protein
MYAIGRGLSVDGPWPLSKKHGCKNLVVYASKSKCPSCSVSTTQNKQVDLPFLTLLGLSLPEEEEFFL